MSFILDALRKAERERKRASVPDPLTVQEPILAAKNRSSFRLAVIIAAVLVGALGSGVWFGVWYGNRPTDHLKSMRNAMQTTDSRVDTRQLGHEEQQLSVSEHAREKDPHQVSARRLGNSMKDKSPMAGRENDMKETLAAPPANVIPAHETDKYIPPPDKNKLYRQAELPDALKQKLPDFSFSIFLYSDEPASRTVRVNGVTRKEGQYITDGLKIEEIVADGVILSYMQYRFHVAIP